jgi:hypothetical protein
MCGAMAAAQPLRREPAATLMRRAAAGKRLPDGDQAAAPFDLVIGRVAS